MIVFYEADQELRAAASELIVRQMADALTAAPINLSDDVAIAIRLSCAGFGSVSIAHLMEQAVEAARTGAYIPAPRSLHDLGEIGALN